VPVDLDFPASTPKPTMDIDFLLDALQAAYVTGTLDGETLGALSERAGVPADEMICGLLERAPAARRWLPATAARWAPVRPVEDALQRTVFAQGPTPGRRAALVSLLGIRPETARELALTLMADVDSPGDLRAAAAELLGRCDDPESLTELRRLMVEGAPGTRRLAAWVLGARGVGIDLDGLEEVEVGGPAVAPFQPAGIDRD
jgi:hypothetical protein